MCTGAAIFNHHDHEDGMDNPKTYSSATESLIAKKLDTAMKVKLDSICQHHWLGDFMELLEGSKALPSY